MNSERISVEEIRIAGNRGPCGGVNMALESASQVLDIVAGREPVYANWDIVNNKPLMAELNARGLVNVRNNWDLVPDGSVVLFSAHGVPPQFHEIAKTRHYLIIDTTCQLVSRVHNLALRAEKMGRHVVYIGVNGHPETMGVMGELQPGNITLVEKLRDVEQLTLPDDKPKIVYSQTTLSTAQLKEIVKALTERYSGIEIPSRWDICYATDSRQQATQRLIQLVNFLLVVGSPHSHNSQELKKIGENAGLPAYSVDYPGEIQSSWFNPDIRRVGITSGASVQDRFLTPVVKWFKDQNPEIIVAEEPQAASEREMTFKLPQKSIEALKTRYNTL